MTVSSHRHRLIHTLKWLQTALFPRVFLVSSRVVLITIVSGVLFMPQAMAEDAINREHAVNIAKGQNGGAGKVLGVTTKTDSAGNTQFAVKIISNGRVRVFTIKKAP